MIRRPFIVFLVCTSLSSGVRAEWNDWSLLGVADLVADDNVNIGRSGNEGSDEYLELDARFARSYQFESAAYSGTQFRLSGELGMRDYAEYDGLSFRKVGINTSFSHKFGLGPQAPRGWIGLEAENRWVDDDNRDAIIWRATLGASKRFTPRAELRAQALYSSRDGESWTPGDPDISSAVYDTDHLELHISGFYSLLPKLRASLRVSYYDGEFDSDCGGLLTGAQNRYPKDIPGLKAVAVDDVFGCRWVLDGDGWGARAGLSWSLSAYQSLQLFGEWREIDVPDITEYTNNVIRLSYVHRFKN